MLRAVSPKKKLAVTLSPAWEKGRKSVWLESQTRDGAVVGGGILCGDGSHGLLVGCVAMVEGVHANVLHCARSSSGLFCHVFRGEGVKMHCWEKIGDRRKKDEKREKLVIM